MNSMSEPVGRSSVLPAPTVQIGHQWGGKILQKGEVGASAEVPSLPDVVFRIEDIPNS